MEGVEESKTGKATLEHYSRFLAKTVDPILLKDGINPMSLFMINGFDAMMIGMNNIITEISILESNSGPVFIGESDFINSINRLCRRAYLSIKSLNVSSLKSVIFIS